MTLADDPDAFPLPEPCKRCGEPELGRLEHGDIHIKLVCGKCGTYQKFLRKDEAGVGTRSLTRRGECVKPKQRQRIFARDGYRCLLCGQAPPLVILTAGHILSHKDGELLGLPEVQIDSDANLMTMCEPCNSGLGRQSLEHWLAVALLNRPRNGP